MSRKESDWSPEQDEQLKEELVGVDVGKLKACPKCGMGDGGGNEIMLVHFCQHQYCPVRDFFRPHREAQEAERRVAQNEAYKRPEFDRRKADRRKP